MKDLELMKGLVGLHEPFSWTSETAAERRRVLARRIRAIRSALREARARGESSISPLGFSWRVFSKDLSPAKKWGEAIEGTAPWTVKVCDAKALTPIYVGDRWPELIKVHDGAKFTWPQS